MVESYLVSSGNWSLSHLAASLAASPAARSRKWIGALSRHSSSQASSRKKALRSFGRSDLHRARHPATTQIATASTFISTNINRPHTAAPFWRKSLAVSSNHSDYRRMSRCRGDARKWRGCPERHGGGDFAA